MSRVFLHYEGEPSFTLKLLLGQVSLATVGDAVEYFVSKYNEKNPSTPLKAQDVVLKLENKSAKPFALTATFSSLSRHEDIYVVPNPSITPSAAPSTPSPTEKPSQQTASTGKTTTAAAPSASKSSATSSSSAAKPASPSPPKSSSSPTPQSQPKPSTPVSNGSNDDPNEWRLWFREDPASTERSEQFRVLGNQKINEKKYNEAQAAYTMGITQSSADPLLFANRALAHLAQNSWQSALEDTDMCLSLSRDNVKALYRRAQALLSMDPSDLIKGPLALVIVDRVLSLSNKLDATLKSTVSEWRSKCLATLVQNQPKEAHEQFMAAQTTMEVQLVAFFKDPLKAARDAFAAGQYVHAVSIYEQILHLRPNHREALAEMGVLWLKAGKPKIALTHFVNLLTLVNHTNSDQLFNILMHITQCYFDMKQYQLAYLMTHQALFIKAGKEGIRSNSKDDSILTIKALMAKALRLNGDAASARMILVTNLQLFEDHALSLDEYGRALEALQQPIEALRVYLKMLVLNMNNPDLKEHFASVLKHKEAFKFFREQLDPAERPEQFYSFIASGVKEFGAVQASVDLYRACLEYKPNFPTYVLNLVHDLEVLNDYNEAFRLLKDHLWHQRNQYVGPVHIAAIWNAVRHIEVLSDHQIWKPKQSRPLPKGGIPKEIPVVPGKVDMSKKYTQLDLDLLATIFTLVKVAYINGVLDILPYICELTDTACEGRDIHDTTIKNENAYFSCITGLMKYHLKTIEMPPSADMPRIYVAGDSHSMTPAWHTMTFKGKPHLVQPLLVTGMKIWHLRPASRFFPKNNFYNVVPRAPAKSTIIFLFGEIDCREGFLVSVQKCRYKDLDEAAQVTIDIYMDVLKSLVETHQYEIFIHPIVPVLDATRHVVIPFMRLLVATIERVKQNSQPGDWTHNIHMLDFFWKLVKEHKQGEPMPEYWGAPPKVPWFFEKEYDLDLTHMNPKYLPLLQDALTVSEKEAESDPHPYVHVAK